MIVVKELLPKRKVSKSGFVLLLLFLFIQALPSLAQMDTLQADNEITQTQSEPTQTQSEPTQTQSEPTQTQSKPLQGSVELSERLPTLDPTLAPGNTWDKDVAKALLLKDVRGEKNYWYQIPNWIAGDWETREAVTTYARDEITGEVRDKPYTHQSKSAVTWGSRKDKNGDVWERLDVGYVTTTSHEEETTYCFVTEFAPLAVHDDSIEIKVKSIIIRVDDITKKIVDAYQEEGLSSYSRISDSIMRHENVKRAFDWEGGSHQFSKGVQNFKKVSAFSPRNKLSDFIAYLRANGKEGIAPQDQTSKSQDKNGTPRKHSGSQ